MLQTYIPNEHIVALLKNILESFTMTPGKGLPLGNLTSQLFANVYLNPFDQFVKHQLQAKHYLRYCDDFVVLSADRQWLEKLVPQIDAFLEKGLRLSLHPNKVFIKSVASGVDFLGWVHFPDHRILRTATKRRLFRCSQAHVTPEALQSYLGLLSHGNTFKVRQQLLNQFWLFRGEQR